MKREGAHELHVARKAGARFRVRIDHDADDGLYYARCLDLRGCHTFGKTRDEALAMIREAISAHLAVSLHAGRGRTRATHPESEIVDLVA